MKVAPHFLLFFVLFTSACALGTGNNQSLYLPYYSESDGGQVVVTPVNANGEVVVSLDARTFQGADLQNQFVMVEINGELDPEQSYNANEAYYQNTNTVNFEVSGVQNGDQIGIALPGVGDGSLVYEAQLSESNYTLATTDYFNVTLSDEF